MNGIQKVSGSIPLISTTHLIHHICPMWFFLFIPLTAVSDSLDSMRHFIPLESVPYFAAASSHCFSSISQTLRFPDISDSLDFMRHFVPLKSVPYFVAASFRCFTFISQFLRFPDISDSLDFMRHFVPLKSVPYFVAASFRCFTFISQFLRFPDISDSLDFMRRFAPLKSVPYLTGLILLTPPQGKKSTLLRCVLFCIDAKKEQYLIYTMVSFLFVLPGIVQKNYFRNASSRTGCMSGRGSA